MTIDLAKFLINNILPSAFKEGQSEIMHKFGIFLIDDMVEYLGYEILQSEWFEFANILSRFSQEKSCILRQAACYGLGIFAENTPAGVMSPDALQNYLNHLINAAKVPKGAEKEKSYGHCKDNAVAAVGKFIKKHNETFDISNYVAAWFSFLPLRHDKPEAILQHELLVLFFLILVRHNVKQRSIVVGNHQLKQTFEYRKGFGRLRRLVVERKNIQRYYQVENKGIFSQSK